MKYLLFVFMSLGCACSWLMQHPKFESDLEKMAEDAVVTVEDAVLPAPAVSPDGLPK